MDDSLLCLGVLEGILSSCCHKLFLKHLGWSSIDSGFLKCSYDPRSYERNFSNSLEKPEKPLRRSNQLRYETTDVRSWSFVASHAMNEPTNEMIYEMSHTLNCGYEIKWSYDP